LTINWFAGLLYINDFKKRCSQLRTDFKDVINTVDMLFTGMLIN